MVEIKFSGDAEVVLKEMERFIGHKTTVVTGTLTPCPVVMDEEPPTVTTTVEQEAPVVTATPAPEPPTPSAQTVEKSSANEPPPPKSAKDKVVELRAELLALVSGGYSTQALKDWLKTNYSAEKADEVAEDRLDEAIAGVKALAKH